MGKIYSSYSVKIKYYRKIFLETLEIYRNAIDWLIAVILAEWESISLAKNARVKLSMVEKLIVKTKKNPAPKYDFGKEFYKFPSYLRRAAINEALGKVSSYKENLKKNSKAGYPKTGWTFPAMYRDNMFVRTGTYTAQIKAFVRNTWDWVDIEFRKSDIDYILHHCSDRKECVPTLRKRGKCWFMDFAFVEDMELNHTPVRDQSILAVDLGLNNACTCSVMTSDGTILARKFFKLTREQDSLTHALNRVKKAQQAGATHTPRLWAKVNGINDDIAVQTAFFIIETAIENKVDTIVMEKLDLQGRKKGGKKQKIHLWKARYVQRMVEDKAHRNGIRFSHVCAWNTSRLAFDGSGRVERNTYGNYSMCKFQSGKVYNCDLNASYNIGARYFIREILKSLSETARLGIGAKVPQCTKRSTCTLSTLISLNAALAENIFFDQPAEFCAVS